MNGDNTHKVLNTNRKCNKWQLIVAMVVVFTVDYGWLWRVKAFTQKNKGETYKYRTTTKTTTTKTKNNRTARGNFKHIKMSSLSFFHCRLIYLWPRVFQRVLFPNTAWIFSFHLRCLVFPLPNIQSLKQMAQCYFRHSYYPPQWFIFCS